MVIKVVVVLLVAAAAGELIRRLRTSPVESPVGKQVIIMSGTGNGQIRTITDYVDDAVVLDEPWDEEPDNTSELVVV